MKILRVCLRKTWETYETPCMCFAFLPVTSFLKSPCFQCFECSKLNKITTDKRTHLVTSSLLELLIAVKKTVCPIDLPLENLLFKDCRIILNIIETFNYPLYHCKSCLSFKELLCDGRTNKLTNGRTEWQLHFLSCSSGAIYALPPSAKCVFSLW